VVNMQAVEDNDKDKQGEGTVVQDTVQEGIREELVNTAVKFLENSRVQSSTQQMKKEFLIKKGLTESEIGVAFRRVTNVVPRHQGQQQPLQSQVPMMKINSQNTFSTKLRDLLNILLLIGGASYSLRYLWKRYISPWLFGAPKPAKTPHELVLETTQAVLRTVEQLQNSVSSLQRSLETHSTRLEQVSQSQQVKPEETGAMQDLKSEIQSVKGLLLSSRSFPPHPTIAPPTIPAWQLETEEADLGPDLVASTMDIAQGEQEAKENQSANASSVSNTSEIEMINPDSQENSSEDGH